MRTFKSLFLVTVLLIGSIYIKKTYAFAVECTENIEEVYVFLVDAKSKGDVDKFLTLFSGPGKALMVNRLKKFPKLKAQTATQFKEEIYEQYKVVNKYISPLCKFGILTIKTISSNRYKEILFMRWGNEWTYRNESIKSKP